MGNLYKIGQNKKNNGIKTNEFTEETILTVKKDHEGLLVIEIEPYMEADAMGFCISEELRRAIINELAFHVGGEFAEDFDKTLQNAINIIASCE